MYANFKYKASVFSLLFSDPDILRELYSAIEGVSLPAGVPVTINTLEDVLFMDRINDISFEIGGKLVVLIEHQSSINPNMALRLLMYIARVYEKIVLDRKLYSTQKIIIPRPEFFVLYNGTAPYPDEAVMRLSEAFESLRFLGLPEKEHPALELEVKVLNINEGKNEQIAKRCRTLAEYSAFIGKVREFEKGGVIRKEAIKRAVMYCRDYDILREFLEKNASEVLNMLTAEWNWDTAKEVWQEEAREEGLVKGLAEGLAKGEAKGKEEIARNALEKGLPVEIIRDITGLNLEDIKNL